MRVGLSAACARAVGAPPGGLLPPGRLIALCERADATFLELDAAMPPAYFAALRPLLAGRREALAVRVVESVFPASRAAAAELAAADGSESRAAVEAVLDTLQVAAEMGAGHVLLQLGEVRAARDRWAEVRRAWLRGELDEDRQPAERLLHERAAHARAHLDTARRALDRLTRAADRHGLRLGLRNPARAIGLPAVPELRLLLEEFAGAPLDPAFDAAAAHLADAMGLVPLAETLAAWKDSPVAHLADACGPIAGLPPGRGELDLAPVVAALPKDTLAVFTPRPDLDEDELLAGVAALRGLAG